MIALIIATQVARVVVYPDRAEVTRAQTAKCPGKAIFEGLPPSADASSLRASTSEGAIESLDLREEPRDAEFGPEAAAVQKQIREQLADLQRIGDLREKANDQQRLAQQLEEVAIKLVSTEIVQPAPDTKAWQAAFERTLQARIESTRLRTQADAQEREGRRKLEDLYRKQQKLGQARQRRDRRVEVSVACTTGESEVMLTYTVGGASWQPAYEARADEDAERVNLSLFGTIQQSTGESWQGADISLSTAVPSQDATPPEIDPLRVYAQEREPPKKVLVRRDELQQHAEAGAEEAPAPELEAAHFAVKGAADIPGDGTPVRAFVASAALPATFAWRAVPRQIPAVFRVADVSNNASFPLLAGPVDLFRRGYVGREPLERVAAGARFHLSFGLEERVRVKRTTLDEIKRETGLFKNNQRFHYAYRVEVTSLLRHPETIEVAEAVPVSELDDVHVELEDGMSPGGEYDKEDGILTWKLRLGPGEKRDLTVAFHVDVPSSYATGM